MILQALVPICIGPRDALLFYVLSDSYSEIQQGIASSGEMKGLSFFFCFKYCFITPPTLISRAVMPKKIRAGEVPNSMLHNMYIQSEHKGL